MGVIDNVDEYGWRSGLSPGSCSYLAPLVLHVLRKYKVRRVFDLGCGNGALSAELAQAGFEVVGAEYDRGGYDIASGLYRNIKFYNLGVQDDPRIVLDSESAFDAVISTEVIEHLYSPHLLPQFAKPLLSKGGVLVLSTPYHGYIKNLALSIFNHWDTHHTPLWHGGHIKFWSRKTLSMLLAQNGFQVVDFYGVGRVPFLWKSMVLVAKVSASGDVRA